MAKNVHYIWQNRDWKTWQYDLSELSTLLNQVHHQQGILLGRMHDIGWQDREHASKRPK